MTIGILALQGCIDPHIKVLEKLGVKTQKVISPEHLENITHLIMPGGESTVMLKLLHKTGLFNPLKIFAQTKPVWGICAGSILAAQEVVNPTQESLNLLPIRAERNAYGSQIDSFKTLLDFHGTQIPADFIRAPKLFPLSQSISVLAYHENQPVILRKDKILASSFHVELGEDSTLHQYFLGL